MVLISALPGASTFDSAMSFGLIAADMVTVIVLGFQFDAEGNLNAMFPGRFRGMGGARTLCGTGAKRVIVAMQHAAKGEIQIVGKCGLPLRLLTVDEW